MELPNVYMILLVVLAVPVFQPVVGVILLVLVPDLGVQVVKDVVQM
jgi:hypothetical protein